MAGIRFGIRLMPSLPVRDLVRAAVAAETAGIDVAWVPDEGFARDVYVTMAAVLGATQRLCLGPGITNPFTRHPAATAAAFASLYEYGDGRCFLGIGAGGGVTLGPLGLEREKPLLHVREAIEAMRALFTGESVSYSGETVQLVGARLATGRIPAEIWVAGRGTQMLKLAARMADGVYMSGVADFFVAEHIGLVRREAAAAGTAPRIALAHYIATDRQLFDQARVYQTFSILDSPPAVRAGIGLSEERTQELKGILRAEGLKAASRGITDEMLQPFVLAGDAEACAERIATWVRELALDQYVFLYGAGVDLPPWLQTVGQIAAAVRRRLSS